MVYLTAHGDDATMARAEVTEPLGYVMKPYVRRALTPVLRTAAYRHRADAERRRLERWLATTLQSIGDGVLVTDTEARVTYLNPAGQRVLGAAPRPTRAGRWWSVHCRSSTASRTVRSPASRRPRCAPMRWRT